MPTAILDIFGKPFDSASLPRTHHRDLPVTSSWSSDDVGIVKATLRLLEVGDVVRFDRAAQLCDSFEADDRIGALLETRLEALSTLPLQVTPAGKTALARSIAETVKSNWSAWFPDAEVKKLHSWGLKLGFGIGELAWNRSTTGWTPKLKTWDLRNVEWRWNTRSFWVNTVEGPVEVTPGDGHWLLYAPHGAERAWMKGLVRPFARLFLMRQLTYRDWLRWCEVHGLPIRVGVVPAGAEKASKSSFINDLLNIGGEATLVAEQGREGEKYDLKLVEAASQSWQGFRQLLAQVDENMAVRMLGQNLTTTMKTGGSYAAADVHNRVRLERREGDANSIAAVLNEQGLALWVAVAHGRPDLAPKAGWLTSSTANVDPANLASFTAVISMVAKGEIPRETGVRLIEACGVPLEQAENIVGEAGKGFKPTPQPAAPAPTSPPSNDKPDDKDEDPEDPKDEMAHAA